MNAIAILRQFIAHLCFLLASAFVLSLAAFLLRRQLRVLLDRWRALGRLGQCVTLVFVSGFVLYGGSKNMAQQRRQQDPDSQYGPLLPVLPSIDGPDPVDAAACRAMSGDGPAWGTPIPRQTFASTANGPSHQPSTMHQPPTTIAPWRSRGAWEDWRRIEFPPDFAFPVGTNQIAEVTLMSQGALRTGLANATPIVALPQRVALEPGESSIHYGLTASNSFIVAWENVCVERSATNRVDASIELFRNGDTLVTIQPATNNHQPATIFTPAPLPEGWIGEGQDAAWANAAFPSNAADIAAMGYDNWLADYIGVNAQNGRYQVKVSVMSLPDGPCYLVCGPYKTVVKSPGVYCFPLEVFEEYTVRTYPEAVPLTFEYDDGFRFDDGDGVMTGASFASLQRSALQRASGGGEENVYTITQFPQVYIHPNAVPLDQAVGKSLRVLCNAANITYRDYSSLWGHVVLNFTGPSEAVIEFAEIQTEVMLDFGVGGGRVCSGSFSIVAPWYPPSTNGYDNVWTNDFGVIGGTNGTTSAGH